MVLGNNFFAPTPTLSDFIILFDKQQHFFVSAHELTALGTQRWWCWWISLRCDIRVFRERERKSGARCEYSSYIREWKINRQHRKTPNKNKNHTKDGWKAKNGWNIVFLLVHTCAMAKQQKQKEEEATFIPLLLLHNTEKQNKPKPANLKTQKCIRKGYFARLAMENFYNFFVVFVFGYMGVNWQMMSLRLEARITAKYRRSGGLKLHHTIFVRWWQAGRRINADGVKGKWCIFNRAKRR